MFSDPSNLKDSYLPDVSFIRRENILQNVDWDKPYPGIPDLAVEVVSPGNTAAEIEKKRRTYLAKGTEQVWIVYPKDQRIEQYFADGNVKTYSGLGQRIETEAMFPGLVLTTDMIFKLPDLLS